MKNRNPRLIKTHSGKYTFIAGAILAPLMLLSLVLAIALGSVLDTDTITVNVVIVVALVAITFISLIAAIVLLFLGGIKDRKTYGKGRWTAKYDGMLTDQQKAAAGSFLQSCGFAMNFQGNAAYFSSASGYISIIELNGTVFLEAYPTSPQLMFTGVETGLYGFSNMVLKNKMRKIIAELLDVINAPKEIKV